MVVITVYLYLLLGQKVFRENRSYLKNQIILPFKVLQIFFLVDTPFEYEMYCVQMVRRNVPGVGEPDHGPPLPRAQTGGGAR